MSVLYVTEQGTTVHKLGRRLVVRKLGRVLETIHTYNLEQVILFGNVQLTAQAIGYLLGEGIDTVFMGLGGRYKGRLVSGDGKNIALRRQQFRRAEDEQFVLEIARRFVRGKLANSRAILRRHQRQRPHEDIESALLRINHSVRGLDSSKTLDEIRGREGAGAAAYFGCFPRLILAEGFPFGGRSRRPPKDAPNALLSFGYTMLLGTVTTAIQVVGLDPFLGSLHAMENGKPSLVLDLMEEFRPLLVDAAVLRSINRRQIVPGDFLYQEDVELPAELQDDEPPPRDDYPVLLRPESIRKWILLYEQTLRQRILYPPLGTQVTWRQVVLEQARRLARHIQGQEQYESFVPR